MSFTKLEPIKGGTIGCLNCGYKPEILPMDALIAVGFGIATLTKNGKVIFDENDLPGDATEESYWTCQMAENEALKDPDHDWRINLIGPLSECHYQRQGEGHWVLYEKGVGFA